MPLGMVDVRASADVADEEYGGEDPLTYSGPLLHRLYVKIRYHRPDGTVEEASEGGYVEVEVGPTGMDPTTVRAREVLREEMYQLLARASKKLRRHVRVSHKAILDAAEGPITAASGE